MVLQTPLVDGSPCGYGGHCYNASCQAGPWQDRFESMYRQNLQISIPVTIVVGIIVSPLPHSDEGIRISQLTSACRSSSSCSSSSDAYSGHVDAVPEAVNRNEDVTMSCHPSHLNILPPCANHNTQTTHRHPLRQLIIVIPIVSVLKIPSRERTSTAAIRVITTITTMSRSNSRVRGITDGWMRVVIMGHTTVDRRLMVDKLLNYPDSRIE